MIHVTAVTEDWYLVEPTERGIYFEARRVHRDELPESVAAAIAVLSMCGEGFCRHDIGVKVGRGSWELEEAALTILSSRER